MKNKFSLWPKTKRRAFFLKAAACRDSPHQMRVSVQCGKRNKDRYTVLSQNTLEILRDYWRAYRPHHPDGLLFHGRRNLSPITPKAANDTLVKWFTAAGIRKKVSMHNLRHSFTAQQDECIIEIDCFTDRRINQ